MVGAGVPGPGLGFWERGEEGWMTGFNNRWDREGATADERRGKDGMWRFAATRRRIRRTEAESGEPCEGERKKKQNKKT